MRKQEIELRLNNHKSNIDALWNRFERNGKDVLTDKKRIYDVEALVLGLSDEFKKLHKTVDSQSKMITEQEERTHNILRILKESGLIEEILPDSRLLQLQNTVDLLHRNPLYKINKVVTE